MLIIPSSFVQFLSQNTARCLRSERFPSCSQASLMILLQLPHLALDSEEEVVQAVVRWTQHQNQGRSLDPKTSKNLLGACLQRVCFFGLTAAQFSKHVVPSGLLTPEESLAFLVNLNAPGQMPLPKYFGHNFERRYTSRSPSPAEEAQTEAKKIGAEEKRAKTPVEEKKVEVQIEQKMVEVPVEEKKKVNVEEKKKVPVEVEVEEMNGAQVVASTSEVQQVNGGSDKPKNQVGGMKTPVPVLAPFGVDKMNGHAPCCRQMRIGER